MPQKKRHLEDAKDTGHKTKRSRLAQDSDRNRTDKALRIKFNDFLEVLNKDAPKAPAWDKSAVIKKFDAKEIGLCRGPTLRNFYHIDGLPVNYAFAFYSKATIYPVKLRELISGFSDAQKKTFAIKGFPLTVARPNKNSYQVNVFYLRCNELTQNAQALWRELSGAAATKCKGESAAYTPLSDVCSLSGTPVATGDGAAPAQALFGSDTNAGGAITTAEIYARLQAGTVNAVANTDTNADEDAQADSEVACLTERANKQRQPAAAALAFGDDEDIAKDAWLTIHSTSAFPAALPLRASSVAGDAVSPSAWEPSFFGCQSPPRLVSPGDTFSSSLKPGLGSTKN